MQVETTLMHVVSLVRGEMLSKDNVSAPAGSTDTLKLMTGNTRAHMHIHQAAY